MSAHRLLVITSCTARKHSSSEGGKLPAEDLYAGEQHRRLMDGVRTYRNWSADHSDAPRLELYILSAGYGLISGDTRLPSYDVTLNGMTADEVEVVMNKHRVSERLAALLQRPFGLALVLLGDRYLRAARLDRMGKLPGHVVAFCGRRGTSWLPRADELEVVYVSNAVASAWRVGLVGLKGAMASVALSHLTHLDPDSMRTRPIDFNEVLLRG